MSRASSYGEVSQKPSRGGGSVDRSGSRVVHDHCPAVRDDDSRCLSVHCRAPCEISERADQQYVAAAQLIVTADAAGERDLAIHHAQRAWAEREPLFILFARHFPEWRSIRSDPRFQAILREMDGQESSKFPPPRP